MQSKSQTTAGEPKRSYPSCVIKWLKWKLQVVYYIQLGGASQEWQVELRSLSGGFN